MTVINPVVGDWYKKTGGSLFEVVAIDDDDGTIEVQHYDGTVEEYEIEGWREMLISTVEPPEDWSGSFDMDREDYGVDRDERAADPYGNPLDELLDS
ncbi:MAG: hypothetical protein OER80_07670 [Gammaproteobacteria bacterium]|nr:hypothetical protein [Gammaproteobacteria bacterium]MDH3766842.1 hypothetical protein [Gammaproteobacteria bacterium]